MKLKIESIAAELDYSSQGNDTVCGTIKFSDGFATQASVPAGISESGKAKPKVAPNVALDQIAKIDALCRGREFTQQEFDEEISSRDFGANATLAVSVAMWRGTQLLVDNKEQPKKYPGLFVLLFEGGKHGSNPRISIQEFMAVAPTLEQAKDYYHRMEKHLLTQGTSINVGREGGFSPPDFDDEKVLSTIKTVLPEAKLALDIAAGHESQRIDFDNLIVNNNIFSIEDPLPENNWDDWVDFMSRYSQRIKIIADDLTATDDQLFSQAIKLGAADGFIIKLDQCGTVTRAVRAVETAKKAGAIIVFSHRGDETNDDWVAGLAVGLQADYVKFGGFARGERMAKYSQLRRLGMA